MLAKYGNNIDLENMPSTYNHIVCGTAAGGGWGLRMCSVRIKTSRMIKQINRLVDVNVLCYMKDQLLLLLFYQRRIE